MRKADVRGPNTANTVPSCVHDDAYPGNPRDTTPTTSSLPFADEAHRERYRLAIGDRLLELGEHHVARVVVHELMAHVEPRSGHPTLQLHGRTIGRARLCAETEGNFRRLSIRGLVFAAAFDAVLCGDDQPRRDERRRAEDRAVFSRQRTDWRSRPRIRTSIQ